MQAKLIGLHDCGYSFIKNLPNSNSPDLLLECKNSFLLYNPEEHLSLLCVVVYAHLPYTLPMRRFVIRKSPSVLATRKQAGNAHGRML